MRRSKSSEPRRAARLTAAGVSTADGMAVLQAPRRNRREAAPRSDPEGFPPQAPLTERRHHPMGIGRTQP